MIFYFISLDIRGNILQREKSFYILKFILSRIRNKSGQYSNIIIDTIVNLLYECSLTTLNDKYHNSWIIIKFFLMKMIKEANKKVIDFDDFIIYCNIFL